MVLKINDVNQDRIGNGNDQNGEDLGNLNGNGIENGKDLGNRNQNGNGEDVGSVNWSNSTFEVGVSSRTVEPRKMNPFRTVVFIYLLKVLLET